MTWAISRAEAVKRLPMWLLIPTKPSKRLSPQSIRRAKTASAMPVVRTFGPGSVERSLGSIGMWTSSSWPASLALLVRRSRS